MSKTLRVGVAGAAWVGQRHLEGLAPIGGVKTVALADPDRKLRADVAERIGVEQQYDTFEQMLASADLDAVVICLPTSMHVEACVVAFKAGLHVMCEKPPAGTAAEMARIAREARARKRVYAFARQPRFSGQLQQARRMIKAGRLGKVYHADTAWVRTRFTPPDKDGWRMDALRGGGVLLDLGIHAIDNAWFAMGCPRPIEVSSGIYTAFPHLAPKGGVYTADDAATGLIRFAGGCTMSFSVSFSLNVRPPYCDKPGPTDGEYISTQIFGDRAGLDLSAGMLVDGRKKDVMLKKLPPTKPVNDFEAQARDFVAAIRTRRRPTNHANEAVTLMKILDAARLSGKRGKAVAIK